MTSQGDLTEAWTSFIVELTHAPEAVERLLAQHTPTREGLCVGCGLPGSGSPWKRWPCGLWSMADAARELARSRTHRSTVTLDKVNAATPSE